MKRPWLLPLVPLYAVGAAWQRREFNRHAERAKRLRDPVVSVGSLSAGGAGKTPFVIALGEALRRAGFGIDVLSRGYGRVSDGALRVRAEGSAAEFGDEPLLIARQLACPVYVASERYRAGTMAETDRRTAREDRRLSLHLLDDGFQHRQLARAVDIALLTREDARDMLLPAGNLREPLWALRRASVIVLRADEANDLHPVLERVLGTGHAVAVWIVDRQFGPTAGQLSTRPLAFCGIARPGGFGDALHSLAITPAGLLPLRDHQRYDETLVRRLIAHAETAGANGFVTTAKDAVKLSSAARALLGGVGPLAVIDVEVRIRDEARCVAEVMTQVESWWRRG